MNKRQASKVKNNLETMSREEQLKRENELLHLEVAYLKKLKAFQENPDTFLEKHKQRWHTNSKKQDSN
jgi:transposase